MRMVICLQIQHFKLWKNYFTQSLNVRNANDVKEVEVHTTQPLVPGPHWLEVATAVAKFKLWVAR
jgi:hypothetical protein